MIPLINHSFFESFSEKIFLAKSMAGNFENEEITQLFEKHNPFPQTKIKNLSDYFNFSSYKWKEHGKTIWRDYIFTLKYILLDLEYIKTIKKIDDESITPFRLSIESEINPIIRRMIKYSFDFHKACFNHLSLSLSEEKKTDELEFSFGK